MSLSLNRGQVAFGSAMGRIQLAGASTWGVGASGYFYKISSGKATQLTATDDTLTGWVDVGFKLSDANIVSNLLTVPTITTSYEFLTYGPGAAFLLPVASGQTLAVTDVGKPINISVSSGIQSADLTNTGTKSFLFVLPPTPEEIAANIVRVYINPAKYGIGS